MKEGEEGEREGHGPPPQTRSWSYGRREEALNWLRFKFGGEMARPLVSERLLVSMDKPVPTSRSH